MPVVNSTQLNSPPAALVRLKARLRTLGISQTYVAGQADVTRQMVCHVLAGRAKSAKVVAVVRRLIADAKVAQHNGTAA